MVQARSLNVFGEFLILPADIIFETFCGTQKQPR